MGILKSAADLVYTIRFLKLLVTPWEETGAYKAGIINADGSRNKDFNIAGSSDAGRPVLASAAGKVIGVSKKFTSYGHAVEIDHGNGWRSFYAHLQEDSIAVSVGQQVSPITQIGRVGSTGNSTGPHLHYEQRQVVDGRSIIRPVILNGHAFNYDKTGTQTFTRPC